MEEEIKQQETQESAEQKEQVEQKEQDAVEEVKPADNEPKQEDNKLDLSKLANAKTKLESLDTFGKEEQVEEEYEYDEDSDTWVDKQGNAYDEKPEPKTKGNKFDSLKWNVEQSQKEYEFEKQRLAYQAEQKLNDIFFKRTGDILNTLNRNQINVLKEDCISPLISQFIYDINNNNINEDTFNQVVKKLDEAIETRMSLYNLRSQQQDIVNEEHAKKFPLETQQPTQVYGVNGKQTWEGANKKEKKNFLAAIYKNLTGGGQL